MVLPVVFRVIRLAVRAAILDVREEAGMAAQEAVREAVRQARADREVGTTPPRRTAPPVVRRSPPRTTAWAEDDPNPL